MTPDHRERHELQRRLEEALGQEAADTLMEALPPHPWDELATKSDLIATKADLVTEFARFDERMMLRFEASESKLMAVFRGELNAAITSQTRSILFSMLGAILATGSLVIAASHLG